MKRLSLIWKLGFVVLLCAFLIVIHSTVAQYHTHITALQQRLEERLIYANTKSEIRTELAQYQPTVASFTTQIISSQNEMFALLETIEKQAVPGSVFVRIPNLADALPTANQTAEDEIIDARITILANGESDELIGFLHRIEHLPYALVFEEWALQTGKQTPYRDEDGNALNLAELTLKIRVPVRNLESDEEKEG